MEFVFSEKCLDYRAPGHPENPERVKLMVDFLEKKGAVFVEPKICRERDLKLIHTPGHIEKVKNNSFSDPDCPNYKNIYFYARLAAGAAIKAAEKERFSLMRPPGHHAGADYVKGFCYFNNIALAVEKTGRPTLIIDFDGHHGNGTQDIFMGRQDITYMSLHKNIFPGTGLRIQDNCYNHRFQKEPKEKNYLEVMNRFLKKITSERNFEQIAVSAGFDGFARDPLASLGLQSSSYYKIGRMIGKLGCPVFAVLEGGYVAEHMGENVYNFVQGLEGNKESGPL